MIWALGMATRFFGSTRSMAGALFGILVWAPNAALCTYCLSSSPAKRRLFWPLITAGCLAELAWNAQTLSKAYIMYSFVPILWTCIYFKGYRRWLIPFGLSLLTFYFFIVAPVIGRAREEIRRQDDSEQVTQLFNVYQLHSIFDIDVMAQGENFFERQFDPIMIGFIYGEVEKYGLLYGESMDYLTYAFVPRFLWPDKPNVGRGAWFTVYLGGAFNEEEATTSTALTSPGELYWNFGTPGVLGGMIIIGSLIGLLWRIAGAKPQMHPLWMLLYFLSIIAVVDNAEAGVMAVSACHRLLVLGPLIWLFGSRRLRGFG
jgi:oligosaccharide repeat unit polymerase